MYQNMDCVLLGSDIFSYIESYSVYNSAGEKITNPTVIYVNESYAIGICVPYGGYIEITMDSNHSMNFITPQGNYTLYTIGAGLKGKVRVVRDYNITVASVTNENGRIVETPITE